MVGKVGTEVDTLVFAMGSQGRIVKAVVGFCEVVNGLERISDLEKGD